jgi:DNA invertase Pin-like site-specific DNA recombinase
MIYIYSRVSTDKQDTNNQTKTILDLYPSAKVVEEVASGAKARPKLVQLIDFLEKGDTLVVYALDRLGRSTRDVLEKIEKIYAKGIILISLREKLDLSTVQGKFMMTIMLAFAELERNIISERIKTALAVKKANGEPLGRPEKDGPISRSTRYRRIRNAKVVDINSNTNNK